MEDVDRGQGIRMEDKGEEWRTENKNRGHVVRMEDMDGGQGIKMEDKV